MRTLHAALLLLCALRACAGAPPRWHELSASYGVAEYARDFGRKYASAEEEAFRGALLAKRLAEALAHNAGGASWKKVRESARDRNTAAAAPPICAPVAAPSS